MNNLQLTLYLIVKNRTFSVRLVTRKGCPLLPLLSNIVMESLVRGIKQEKYMKEIAIVEYEIRL